MASGESILVVRREEGIARIEFTKKDILDESNIQQIGEEISKIIDQSDRPKVLISFSNVRHLSSAALGTLITINNKVKNKGGQLRLSDIDPQIYEVFVITRLNQLFQIHEHADEAISSFA